MSNASQRTRHSSAPLAVALHQNHRGEPVRVGPYTVLAAGTQYGLQAGDLARAEVIIPLTERVPPLPFGPDQQILHCPLPDFGGVPDNWGEFLRQQVIPLLDEGKKVMAFCVGSHGRTGTFIASLIALLEPETKDPVAAARERHCCKAVESEAQATAIFALRGKKLPRQWVGKFHC
jgi:hypothetical protein